MEGVEASDGLSTRLPVGERIIKSRDKLLHTSTIALDPSELGSRAILEAYARWIASNQELVKCKG